MNTDHLEFDNSESQLSGGHLWDYVQIVLQRLPLAIATLAAVLIIGLIYTLSSIPRYTATSRVQVESSEINLTDIKGAYDPGSAALTRREFLQTQVKLITSPPVLEAALEKADLLADRRFKNARDPVKQLAKRLLVVPVRNTFLIDVSIEDENPQMAARIVNAVVDAFLADNRQRRLGISADGLEELYKKADDLRAKLDAATAELQAFMVTNTIVSFEKAQNLVLETLMTLNSELARKEPERMALQARVEAARDAMAKGSPADSLPDVMNSEVVKAIRLDLVRLEKDYSQMLERFGTNHPQLQAVSTQLEALRTKLAMEANSILTALETQYHQAVKEEKLLRDRLKVQEAEVFRFNELAARYNVLKQNKESIENTYQTIIRRIQEIDSNRMGAQGENIFVISRATPPVQRSWPSHGRNLALALLLGITAAVGLCFFLDYMDITIKGEPDVKQILKTRVLAGIPDTGVDASTASESSDLILSEQPKSHAAEAFRALRTVLAFNIPGEPLRSVVISSTMPAEGKSLVAINLSIAEANVGRRTLLVDGDMRKPRLHRAFSLTTKRGFSNLLAGQDGVTLDQVVMETSVKNLWVLPCGPLPPNPVEILDSDRFKDLVREFKAKFDFVVFDSPPGLSLADPLVMARQTDGMLLVVRSFQTAKAPAQHFVENIRASNVRLLGVVLNNVDVPKGGYYYYGSHYGRYHYYYHYRYAHGETAPEPHPGLQRAVNSFRKRLTQWLGRQAKS